MSKSIPFLLILVALTNCATLYSKKEDVIEIKSDPSGAQVYSGATLIGTTPLKKEFKRSTGEPPALTIKKAGFPTKTLRLERTVDPAAFLNLGFITTTFGATSWGIDAGTGAMFEYSPKSYYVDLHKSDKNGSLNEEQLMRKKRVVFALINYNALLVDIAKGDGEFIGAYYKLAPTKKGYQDFLKEVKNDKTALLSQKDGLELNSYIESNVL